MRTRRLYTAKYSIEITIDATDQPFYENHFVFDVKVKPGASKRDYDPRSMKQEMFCNPRSDYFEKHILDSIVPRP